MSVPLGRWAYLQGSWAQLPYYCSSRMQKQESEEVPGRQETGKSGRKAEARVTPSIEATMQFGDLPPETSEEPVHRCQGRTERGKRGNTRKGTTHPSLWAGKLQYKRKDYKGKPVNTRASALLFCPTCPGPPSRGARRGEGVSTPSLYKPIQP